ncbi:hypothetical protein [Melittangium boletus]|uniref:hypothetical protein n=1 Tax=Melittangium boletus TaxID=83453 RepID=UPI0012FE3CF4|nr:hypothetical protein [Melittangium boletus]
MSPSPTLGAIAPQAASSTRQSSKRPRSRTAGYGLYREGPLIGRITDGAGLLVTGTLLYGQLWTTPGLIDEFGEEAIIGRYSRAVLPNGQEYPVCIALGGSDGRMPREPSEKPGTFRMLRDSPISAVWRWP